MNYRVVLRRAGVLLILMMCFLPLQSCVVAINTDDPATTYRETEFTSDEPTVIYLVRHAEKAVDSGDDPKLSLKGDERARALVRFFTYEAVDVLLSSDFRRTRATLEPLALRQDLVIRNYDAGDPAGLVSRVFENFEGRTVVIAGHSNTVPDLVERFMSADGTGTGATENLGHDDYEHIYVVIRPRSGFATLLKLAYSGTRP